MLFAIQCEDKPDSVDLRKATRSAHLEYLNGLGAKLKFAGPFLDENEAPCGSLLVVEAEDKAGAEAIASGDPYGDAGLFQTVTVRRWVWSVNNPDG